MDGAASIGIGFVLAAVAIFLCYETKGPMIGEAAHEDLIREVRALATTSPDRETAFHRGPVRRLAGGNDLDFLERHVVAAIPAGILDDG